MSSSTAEGENRSLLRSTSTSPRPTPIPRRQGSYGAISTSGHSDDSTSTSDTAATETEESRLSVKNDGDKTPIKVAKKFSEIWPSILGLSTACVSIVTGLSDRIVLRKLMDQGVLLCVRCDCSSEHSSGSGIIFQGGITSESLPHPV